MLLEKQFQTFIYSFVFGIFFNFMFNLNYRILFSSKKIFKVIVNIVFVAIHTLIYFIFLKIINSGVFHIYFLMFLIIGFLFGNYYFRKLRKIV